MKSTVARLIRKLERYEPLSADAKKALEAAPFHVETFGRHDMIVRQGDKPTHSCLVLEGFVGRVKLLSGGAQQILGFEIAGDFADLQSLYLKTMDHGLEALTSARVAKFSHKTMQNLMSTQPQLARAFAWDMAIDGAIQREWMTSMGRRTSYQHAAHILCELLIRLRAVGLAEEDEYQLPVTQADLADAFGISTVHVNRTLQELRGDGLIELKGSVLKILDVNALKAIAGFDASYLE